jgi:hypothetical protein
LTIPGEVRNRIYKFVFGYQHYHVSHDGRQARPCLRPEKYRSRRDAIKDCTIGQSFSPALASHHECRYSFSGRNPGARSSICFLLTCRQIYSEAAQLPFILNTFVFQQCGVLQRFCNRNRTAHVGAIRSIVLEHLVDIEYTSHKLLSSVTSILIFALVFDHSDWRSVRPSRLKTVSMLRSWMPSLAYATVCLEHCGTCQKHRTEFRAIERELEERLIGGSVVCSRNARLSGL